MGDNDKGIPDVDADAAAATTTETLSDQDDEGSEEQHEDEPSDAASDIVEEEDESLHAASSASTSPQTIFEDESTSRKRRISDLEEDDEEEEGKERKDETEAKESTEETETDEDPETQGPGESHSEDKKESEKNPEDPSSQVDSDGDVPTQDDEKSDKSCQEKDEEKEPGEEEEEQEGEANNETRMDVPPKVIDGISEFHVPTICQHVVCGLCRGIYREPMTTIKCQHTFCKSCLTIALHSAWHTRLHNSCPTCHTYLGRSSELASIAIPDRTLEALIDKVLFPEIAAADARAEADFYRQRGMARKVLSSAPAAEAEAAKRFQHQHRRHHRSMAPRVVFQLLPANDDLPSLHHPWLQVAGTIRMRQLKKLVRNLLLDGDEGEDDGIEICCNDVPLGDELSVQFVQRSVWMGKADESLQLTYRFSTVQDLAE